MKLFYQKNIAFFCYPLKEINFTSNHCFSSSIFTISQHRLRIQLSYPTQTTSYLVFQLMYMGDSRIVVMVTVWMRHGWPRQIGVYVRSPTTRRRHRTKSKRRFLYALLVIVGASFVIYIYIYGLARSMSKFMDAPVNR